MNLKDIAANLGIDYVENTNKINTEQRYLVIVELLRKDKRFKATNITPITDLDKAKELALSKLRIRIRKDDQLAFRVFEVYYADVPIGDMLNPNKRELQAIYSRWWTPHEIAERLKTN